MVRCPHCGSTAQVQEIETNYIEDGWGEITVYRDYKCGCGTYFRTAVTYITYDDEEVIKEERL